MSNSRQVSQIILPYNSQLGDNLVEIPSFSNPKKVPSKVKWLIVVFMIMIVVGLVLGLYVLKKEDMRDQREDISESELKRDDLVRTKLIIDSNSINGKSIPQPSQVLELVIRDPKLTSFDTTSFTSLQSLTIQQNVKLDDLVINNTQLVEFVYTSQQLKTLKLINNSKLVLFYNSSLPSLTHLDVIKTPVQQFINNSIFNLQYLEFTDSKIEKLQFVAAGVKDLVVQNCGKVDISSHNFYEYTRLETLVLSDTEFEKGVASLKQMSELSTVNITGARFSQGIKFENTPKLTTLNVQTDFTANFILIDTPNLTNFRPKIKQTNEISLIRTGIVEFTVQTTNVGTLILGGEYPKKIQDNIPGLNILILEGSKMNDTELAAIKAPSLKTLTIENCPNIKTLNATFLVLVQLQFVSQTNFSLTSLNAPKLQRLNILSSFIHQINTLPFASLRAIYIQSSNITFLIVQFPVQILTIQQTLQPINLTLNSTQLYTLDISSVASITIQNNNFPNIQSFQLTSCSNIKVVNNTFNKDLLEFVIKDTNSSVVFENNTFLYKMGDHLNPFEFYENNASKLKQKLTGIHNVHLFDNVFDDFQNVLEYAGEVRELDVSGNVFQKVARAKGENLTDLKLERVESLVEFSDNQFVNLTTLSFLESGNLSVFKNNILPKLTNLNIRFCDSLSKNQILKQFESLKQRGTQLTVLKVGKPSQQFNQKVKQLFPNIEIYEW